MTNSYPPTFGKIVNPELARMALHGAETFGEFRVIVRLAKPRKYPSYMRVTGLLSPVEIKACVSCDQIGRVSNDHDVVSVELREHVMN